MQYWRGDGTEITKTEFDARNDGTRRNRMNWAKIRYYDEYILAADFLDGALIRFFPNAHPQDDGRIFAPGWRVKQATGDADGPSLVRRGGPTSEYKIRFVLDE